MSSARSSRPRWLWRLLLGGVAWVAVCGVALHFWGRHHVNYVSGETDLPVNCFRCHLGLHPGPDSVTYLSPVNLEVSPDGASLYVVCDTADELLRVDTHNHKVVGRVRLGRKPHGLCLTNDGRRAFVTIRHEQRVQEVALPDLKLGQSFVVGGDPCAIALDADEKTLYVGNASTNDLSVIDLATGKETKRLAAGRGPYDAALDARSGRLYFVNRLTNPVPHRTPPVTEVTVVDTHSQRVVERIMGKGVHLFEGVTTTPEGEVLLSLVNAKNLLPATQMHGGFTMTHGIGWIGNDAPQALQPLSLDNAHRFYADNSEVAVAGNTAYVAHSGADTVSVVDLNQLRSTLAGLSPAHRRHAGSDLGLSAKFVVRRLAVGSCPKGLAVSPAGDRVYVANRLSDDLSVIDTATNEVVATVDLGGPKKLIIRRRGEQVFNSAQFSFQGGFSCRSCHPDEQVDGLTYDLQPDGLGINILDNRALTGLRRTAPFKWSGHNPSVFKQCGPRFAMWLSRVEPLAFDDLSALVAFIMSRQAPPNPHQQPGGGLTEAQERGRELYYRTEDNTGKPIPPLGQCHFCHPSPKFTDKQMHDVGTGKQSDTRSKFDTPHLNDIYASAPYLHDGSAATLEEIWTVYNPDDQHGVTNDLSKAQLNDLIEYLKSL